MSRRLDQWFALRPEVEGGPWRVRDTRSNELIAEFTGPEAEARAKLVAQGPDLLRALRRFLKVAAPEARRLAKLAGLEDAVSFALPAAELREFQMELPTLEMGAGA